MFIHQASNNMNEKDTEWRNKDKIISLPNAWFIAVQNYFQYVLSFHWVKLELSWIYTHVLYHDLLIIYYIKQCGQIVGRNYKIWSDINIVALLMEPKL